MSNRSPNPIGFMIDPQNTGRYSRPPRRPPSFRVTAQTVNPPVQRHKNTVGIYHANRAHIPVASLEETRAAFFLGA